MPGKVTRTYTGNCLLRLVLFAQIFTRKFKEVLKGRLHVVKAVEALEAYH